MRTYVATGRVGRPMVVHAARVVGQDGNRKREEREVRVEPGGVVALDDEWSLASWVAEGWLDVVVVAHVPDAAVVVEPAPEPEPAPDPEPEPETEPEPEPVVEPVAPVVVPELVPVVPVEAAPVAEAPVVAPKKRTGKSKVHMAAFPKRGA